MLERNKGFTLVELIVTVVVSGITLLMLAFLVSGIINSWNKIKAKNERYQTQTIIERCFESTKEAINKNEETPCIDMKRIVIYNDSEQKNMMLYLTKEGSKFYLVHNGERHELERLSNIIIVKISDNSILVDIVFDDDSIIEKKYTFKNTIIWR